MMAAILAAAAALFGLQACRDVESEKTDQVNHLIPRYSIPLLLVISLSFSSPLLPNSRGFAHKVRILNYRRRSVFSRTASLKPRQAIDQASAAPINQFLADTVQPRPHAQGPKDISAHRWITVMFPVEHF